MHHPYVLWSDPLPRAGWLNMAIDATLLERAQRGERWLRLYAWEPTLSFGRHEPAGRRYDADRVAALGLATVRRPTGGRAVWHAGELTYAVAAPADELGALRQAYRDIHLMLRDAVRSLGIPAELAPLGRAAGVDAGACFASPAGGEILVAGGKVVGSAQLRRGAALLQHGSILLDDDQTVVAGVTRGQAPVDRSLPLCRAAGRPVSWAEAAAAVAAAAAAAWGRGSPPLAEQLTETVERAASSSERFRSAAWTWSGLLDA
ncbi:MAG: lipoate--protein ligase family protein [Gemmatimonadales bacterium]